MIIDCGSCAHSPALHPAGSPDHAAAEAACGDCVVSVLLGLPDSGQGIDSGRIHETGHAVAQVDDDHEVAIAVLAQSGLIPPLRLVPRSQAS